MENNAFDKLIRDALAQHQVPFDPQAWERMEHRLDRSVLGYRRIILVKAVEAGALALLLWAVVGWLGDSSAPQVPLQHLPAPSVNPSVSPTPKLVPDVVLPSVPTGVSQPIVQAGYTSAPTSATAPESAPTVVNRSTAAYESVGHQVTSASVQAVLPDVVTTETSGASALSITSLINTNAYDLTTTPVASRAIAPTYTAPLVLTSAAPIRGQSVFCPPKTPPTKRKPVHLGLVLAPTMNTAHRTQQMRMGVSAGALVLVELSEHFGIETGLMYGFKRYDLENSLISTTEFANAEDIVHRQMHLLEVPMNLQYTPVRSRNWRVFGTAGLSAHMVMVGVSEGVQYHRDAVEGITVSLNLGPSVGDVGIVQGGNWGHNSYLTANVGLGLERQITHSAHLFIQPRYQFPMSAVGEHRDRIGTFALYMGARTML